MRRIPGNIILGLTSLFAALLVVPRDAYCDPAEILIRQGVELRRQGDNVKALEKFEAAYRMSHTPRASAQVGLCQLALSNWTSAEEFLAVALEARSDEWVSRYRQTLEESLDEARRHLAVLAVEGTPAGANVTAGTKYAGQLPSTGNLYLPPGLLTVRVSHDGFNDAVHDVELRTGSPTTLAINLAPKSAEDVSASPTPESGGPPSTPESSADNRSDRSHYWWWVGAAAVAGGVATAFLLAGGKEYPNVEQTIPVGP